MSSFVFRKASDRKNIIACVLGVAVILSAILFGYSYLFFAIFLVFSVVSTLLWRRAYVTWVLLVLMSAAVPVTISKYNVACTSIFAILFICLNMRYLFQIPKWLYVAIALISFGMMSSAMNWMSGDYLRSMMRQLTFAFNVFLSPFIFIPVVFIRMRQAGDHVRNLQYLLFGLIVPSTVIFLLAKAFGNVTNAWQSSLHTSSLAEGFYQYQLGRVVVNFSRTQVGFVLAALTCASTAIVVSRVKIIHRVAAGGCLAINLFMLLATGSFGSGLACFCGLAVIFLIQFQTIRFTRVLAAMGAVLLMLTFSYAFSPSNTKEYLSKRFEHRVVNLDNDRLVLWMSAVRQLVQHPEGVGLTLTVGDTEETFIHNEYLTYAVSYGLVGGLAYPFVVSGLLLSFLRIRKKAIKDPSSLAIYLAGVSVLIAIALNCMTDHINQNRWYYNLIWSIIWYSYCCCMPFKKKPIYRHRIVPNKLNSAYLIK